MPNRPMWHRPAHDGGHDLSARERIVKPLVCGHEPQGPPQLSNPDRWWCCGAFQKMKGARR